MEIWAGRILIPRCRAYRLTEIGLHSAYITTLVNSTEMPLYELTHESITAVAQTTMHERSFRERDDLQRLLKNCMRGEEPTPGTEPILGEELYVLAEEFSEWQDSRRRIDLLALDRDGSLVVIELKRTEDGGHMELQAIRYAAMVSTLSFRQAVVAHAKFLGSGAGEAEAALLAFLGLNEAPEAFGQRVRIVLVSAEFSRELTTAVLWLNDSGLDIRCVRLRPYSLAERTLLEIEQIIPLPEATLYTTSLKFKQQEARQAAEATVGFTRYLLTVNGRVFAPLLLRNLVWQVVASAVAAGLSREALMSILAPGNMVLVDGSLRGSAFLAAAQEARSAAGYVFRPERMFSDDEHLIDFEGKTLAVTKMWSGPTGLAVVDQIVAAVPEARISYARVA